MEPNRFRKIAVLMGGPSSEREVSLRSGAAIAKGLRQKGYEVAEVDIRGRELELPPGIDAVFIALHGEFGEDGDVQSLLKGRGIPYTGSGVESSRLAFDKVGSKKVFIRKGIPTPDYEVLQRGGKRQLKLPVVVKPVRQGSSIGLHRVFAESEWAAAMEDALKYDADVLVEQFIEGRELTVGVVGDQVLPVVEIRAPGGFYDYAAKYTKGKTEYLVPAPITAEQAKECQSLGLRTFVALGCRGMGRVDIRMTPEGRCHVLEMNSIPGFTETSLLPKAARAAGIEFPELCDRILRLAVIH